MAGPAILGALTWPDKVWPWLVGAGGTCRCRGTSLEFPKQLQPVWTKHQFHVDSRIR